MRIDKNKRKLMLVVCVLIIIIIVSVIIFSDVEKNDDTVIVGFIMSGSADELGWNGMHYDGIKSACDEFGVKLLIKENVEEFTGECITAVKELAQKGAGMILLSSYGYSQEVKDLVREYPDIVFYCNSSEFHEENMTSYFVRMYQVRYLAGILAGIQTQSGKIGYVAAMPNNEVNRGINAFTLGVRKVNPKAQVVVAWTGSWDDEQTEKQMTKAIIENEAVDIVTYHQNGPYVIEAADELGISSIGYHEVFSGFSDNYLTSVVCNWEMVYTEIVKEYLYGRGNANTNYWIGLEHRVAELSEYSSKVSGAAAIAVAEARSGILSGKDVFSGLIYDTDGNQRCAVNETISDDILLEQFDWYVEGVRFYEE